MKSRRCADLAFDRLPGRDTETKLIWLFFSLPCLCPQRFAVQFAERGEVGRYYQTIEHATYGGALLVGLVFGFALSPSAMIDRPSQFDFYSGGGLDTTSRAGFAARSEFDPEKRKRWKASPRLTGVPSLQHSVYGAHIRLSADFRRRLPIVTNWEHHAGRKRHRPGPIAGKIKRPLSH